jgi:RNA polymerase sigma-70 factor, ECF subfamily
MVCREGRENRSTHCKARSNGRQLNLRVDVTDQQEDSDHELVAATASGEPQAFERLYHRYERCIYNYARTFVRRPTSAEEVVIDTMMAVWHGARGFAGNSRVSTWILGIARHKALDAVRKSKHESEAAPLDQAAEIIDTAAAPSELVNRDHQAQLMRNAIARLSPDHQEILRLAFYEELPYEDIAALLSIPDNTVKTRVFYAKQQLRHQLANSDVGSFS